MPTPHIEAAPQDFAEAVLLPGDPLRAQHIAEQFLEATGRIFREITDGMMKVLRARSQLKNEFRMPRTEIRPVENNKTRIKADCGGIFPKRSICKRVKRSPGYILAAMIQQQ